MSKSHLLRMAFLFQITVFPKEKFIFGGQIKKTDHVQIKQSFFKREEIFNF